MTQNNQRVQELPDGKIVIPPMQVPAAQQPVNLADPVMLGAVLASAGVDPVAASQIVSNVQAIIAGSVMAAVHQIAGAVNYAQQVRSAQLKASIEAIPPVDMFGARHAVAYAAAHPEMPIVSDPTPRRGLAG